MHPDPLNVIPVAGAQSAAPGYDHSWFSWSATTSRAPRSWPGGCSVALCVLLDLTAFEFSEKDSAPVPGGRGMAPYPDFPRASHREFGHRVGAFRCIDMLQTAEMPFTIALDVLTATHYRAVAERASAAAGGVVAAGLSANRAITSAMSESEERHYIASALEVLDPFMVGGPRGWLGPQRSESARTPRLLAEADVDYVLDWGNDDAPYPFAAAAAGLWGLPAVWELADVNALFHRGLAPWRYADMLLDYVGALADEAPQHGVAVTVQLSPWLTGQAFRASAIQSALAELAADPRIWTASAPEIIAEART